MARRQLVVCGKQQPRTVNRMAEASVEMNGEAVNVSPRKKARTDCQSRVTVVLGAQWGDEGKGKVVDMLARDVDIVCRCQVSQPGKLPPAEPRARLTTHDLRHS